jgi:hypothetical protein
MMGRYPKGGLSASYGNLAMRQVRGIPGGKTKDGGIRTTFGVSIPIGWFEAMGIKIGDHVLLSRHKKEVRIYPVDEKQLLESLEASLGDEE